MSTDITEVQDDGTIIELLQGGSYTVAKVVEYAGELSDLSFLQLSDTPKQYVGNEGKTVVVNQDGTGLDFSKTYSTFISLTDTPTRYEGKSNALVAVNQDGTGLTFLNCTVSGVNIEYFTQLADVENSYEGKGNYLVTVKQEEDGLEFSSLDTVLPDQDITAGNYSYPKIVVDIKGRITAIEEGKPFEFDPFPEGQLLVGDGSSTPASFPQGLAYQVIATNAETLGANWTYIDSLRTQNGNLGLIVQDQSQQSYSALKISSTDSSITVEPSSNQDLSVNSGGDLTVNAGQNFSLSQQSDNSTFSVSCSGSASFSTLKGLSVTTTSGLTLNTDIIVATGKKINSESDLLFNPNNGKLSIDPSISPEQYTPRITSDNDIATKGYVDQAIAFKKDINLLTKTATQLIPTDGSPLTFTTGPGWMVSLTVVSTNQVNPECSVQVTDTLGRVLVQPNQCPYLGIEPVMLYLGVDGEELTESYGISVTLENWQYGDISAFVSYYHLDQV